MWVSTHVDRENPDYQPIAAERVVPPARLAERGADAVKTENFLPPSTASAASLGQGE
ncbi:MAG: hypothetical protein R3A48_22875 [Polyangiales bacterium]